MSLFWIKEPSDSLTIGVWRCEESADELLGMVDLFEQDRTVLQDMRVDVRKIEFLAARILTRQILGYPASISYNTNGKPLLDVPETDLSISHTKGYVAVAMKKGQRTGIDIQTNSAKVERIAHKFLHNDEQSAMNSMDALHVIWCCKESLFKMYSDEHPVFATQMRISGYLEPDKGLTAAIYTQNKWVEHIMGYEKLENAHLVYVIGN